MPVVPDFTDTEVWTVRTALKERYGTDKSVEFADTELRLSPGARELTQCPALFWEHDDAHFVVVKVDASSANRFRCQFYYRLHEMFGTGKDEYEDLGDCVMTLLRVQADHEARRAG